MKNSDQLLEAHVAFQTALDLQFWLTMRLITYPHKCSQIQRIRLWYLSTSANLKSKSKWESKAIMMRLFKSLFGRAKQPVPPTIALSDTNKADWAIQLMSLWVQEAFREVVSSGARPERRLQVLYAFPLWQHLQLEEQATIWEWQATYRHMEWASWMWTTSCHAKRQQQPRLMSNAASARIWNKTTEPTSKASCSNQSWSPKSHHHQRWRRKRLSCSQAPATPSHLNESLAQSWHKAATFSTPGEDQPRQFLGLLITFEI